MSVKLWFSINGVGGKKKFQSVWIYSFFIGIANERSQHAYNKIKLKLCSSSNWK